jgi:HK97 gp10 family phage protein
MSKVEGLDDMLRRIGEVEAKVGKKLVKSAVDQGGGVVLKAFTANIPPNLANLKRAAGKQTTQKAGVAVCRVGVRKQYAKDRKTGKRKLSATGKRVAKAGGSFPSRWFHLAEKGTKSRVQTTTGRATGAMPKTPMLQPAVDQTAGPVREKMADVLREGLK